VADSSTGRPFFFCSLRDGVGRVRDRCRRQSNTRPDGVSFGDRPGRDGLAVSVAMARFVGSMQILILRLAAARYCWCLAHAHIAGLIHSMQD